MMIQDIRLLPCQLSNKKLKIFAAYIDGGAGITMCQDVADIIAEAILIARYLRGDSTKELRLWRDEVEVEALEHGFQFFLTAIEQCFATTTLILAADSKGDRVVLTSLQLTETLLAAVLIGNKGMINKLVTVQMFGCEPCNDNAKKGA